MVFKNKDNNKLEELISNFDNLIYFKSIYGQKFKHNKNKNAKQMKSIEEIFVENVHFTDSFDNAYSKKRGMPLNSSYSDKFWKHCACDFYYHLDNSFLKKLKML